MILSSLEGSENQEPEGNNQTKPNKQHKNKQQSPLVFVLEMVNRCSSDHWEMALSSNNKNLNTS